MAKVIKKGTKFVVVNSLNKVRVGTPNTFTSQSEAKKRARQIKCSIKKNCPHKS